jgi:anti-sigma-K factor RskA
MENSHWTDRLSEYVDGELSPAERAAAERHLATCGECAALVEDLGAVARAAALLPDVDPGRDLWPSIRRRLQPRGQEARAWAPRLTGMISTVTNRRIVLTVPQLAAAALAIALLSGTGAWALLGVPAGPDAVLTALSSPSDVVLAAYEPAMTTLEAEYTARRGELDPETIVAVERNLAIIDAAIREARDALAADPSSGFLNAHLAATVRKRMNLLREVASI